MYTIELILKNTPMPVAVQRKTAEEAGAVYDQVLAAIRSGSSNVLELTCDRQPEKKVAVLVTEVSGVQMYEKSATAGSGKQPGFFAMAQ